MLVLTRKNGEVILIGDQIRIEIIQIKGKQVRLGIQAPKETSVYREEVFNKVKQVNKDASHADPSQAEKFSKDLKK